MSTDKIQEIASFLRTVKLIMQLGKSESARFTLATVREKNLQTLAALELDLSDVADVIMSLATTDYSEGPLKDSIIKGDLWVFGKVVKGSEVYIKLKIIGDNRKQQVAILSFHQPERKIKYPLK